MTLSIPQTAYTRRVDFASGWSAAGPYSVAVCVTQRDAFGEITFLWLRGISLRRHGGSRFYGYGFA